MYIPHGYAFISPASKKYLKFSYFSEVINREIPKLNS